MMFLWVFIMGGLIYLLFKEHTPSNTTTPYKRIKERLAEGDITLEEYRQLKQILEEKL
jgi:uncharacterized membrane protein